MAFVPLCEKQEPGQFALLVSRRHVQIATQTRGEVGESSRKTRTLQGYRLITGFGREDHHPGISDALGKRWRRPQSRDPPAKSWYSGANEDSGTLCVLLGGLTTPK
jgi:hypothetical protein